MLTRLRRKKSTFFLYKTTQSDILQPNPNNILRSINLAVWLNYKSVCSFSSLLMTKIDLNLGKIRSKWDQKWTKYFNEPVCLPEWTNLKIKVYFYSISKFTILTISLLECISLTQTWFVTFQYRRAISFYLSAINSDEKWSLSFTLSYRKLSSCQKVRCF